VRNCFTAPSAPHDVVSQLGWHVVYASAGMALRSSSCQLSLRCALPAVPHSLARSLCSTARSLCSTLCHYQVTMLSSWASLSLVDGAVDHLGVFTTFVNIVMYGAPLSTLGQVRPRRAVGLTRCNACARSARLPRRVAHSIAFRRTVRNAGPSNQVDCDLTIHAGSAHAGPRTPIVFAFVQYHPCWIDRVACAVLDGTGVLQPVAHHRHSFRGGARHPSCPLSHRP
jgi:hypothetical protein